MTEVRTNQRYLRQLGIYNPGERPHDAVTFVGLGGIGSFAAFGAAKLGIPRITLYDGDEVEPHNQPNQFYREGDVGEPKAEALADHITADRGSVGEVDPRPVHVTGAEDELAGVVVSGLDSMAARANVWEAIKLNPAVPLYIDARIGGQLIVIYTLNPTAYDDVEAYEKTLHSDEEAEPAPCTERGVIDVGLQCGALITRLLRRHFAQQEVPRVTVFNQETLSVKQGGWIR